MKQFLEAKFNQTFNGKIDPFKYFFGHVIKTIETEDIKDDYAVHNFSGEHSMSNKNQALPTVNLMLSNYSGKKHLDIGASRGYLCKAMNENGVESYGLDGWTYGIDNNQLDIPMEKYVICDMTAFDFSVLDFEKYFDISTAFEITEHIHEKDIKRFYDNVVYMSKEHICSIHTGGVDSTMDIDFETNHHNVKPTEWWVDFLSQYGKVTLLPELKTNMGWGESEFLKVVFS